MCGRFTLGASASELIQQFGLTGLPAWTPRDNIAPTQEVLVVHQFTPDARREGSLFRWGPIPPWAEGPAIGSRMINTRAARPIQRVGFLLASRRERRDP